MCVKYRPRYACAVHTGYSGMTGISMRRCFLMKKFPEKAESVVPDLPLQIAQASFEQHLKHMHQVPFSLSSAQKDRTGTTFFSIMVIFVIKKASLRTSSVGGKCHP